MTRLAALLAIVSIPFSASAVWFRPVEPFHLQPVAPASGVLFEARPTFFEARFTGDDDFHFGMGWLFEGRLALLERRLHFALAFPLGMGFVEDHDPAGLGNLELGGGWGDALGTGGGRWGVGMRIATPTAQGDAVPQIGGYAGRPYNGERHSIDAANPRVYGDLGIDDGTFVGQLETGFGLRVPDDGDNELVARFGFLVGVHLAPRTILMMEMTWLDAITDSNWDGQVSFQPGVSFPASTLDLALYITVPVDSPLGGNAFAMGFQLLWNP